VHYTTTCNTQSSAPEDGRDYRPKHVEPIGIVNKPLLLHLVGVYIIYINDARSNKYQISKKKPLVKTCLTAQVQNKSYSTGMYAQGDYSRAGVSRCTHLGVLQQDRSHTLCS